MSSTEHSFYSSYREALLEHLFAGEVMRYLLPLGLMPARLLSCLALLALLPAAAHAPAEAQRLPAPLAEIRGAAPAWPGRTAPLARPPVPGADRPRPRYAGMVAGGLLAGAAGAGVAYLLVHGTSRDIGTDVATAAGGGAVGIPLGVHLGNGGRGDPALTFAAALGAGLGSIVLAAAEVGPAEPLLLGAPAAALAAGVFVQARTTR